MPIHTKTSTPLTYSGAESLCSTCRRTQVVVIDWIIRLKINKCMSPGPKCFSYTVPYLTKHRVSLGASPLNAVTFHSSTHLLTGHRVSPMLRPWTAGDVCNLSGQPTPYFTCSSVTAGKLYVCTRGFQQESHKLCRQPRQSWIH